jgi:16S rRNA (guanine(966)-N(2))-methyltransferase RsmD
VRLGEGCTRAAQPGKISHPAPGAGEFVPTRAPPPALVKIATGEFRGRALAAPPGKATRPMLGRVRESMFATFGGIEEDLPVLDLFSGSGSMGLEAVSRGASFVRCVERGRPALEALRANVRTLGVEDRVEVLAADALAHGSWAAPDGGSGPWAAVVLMDPPYPDLRGAGRRRVLEAAATLIDEVLLPGGCLLLHGHPRDLEDGAVPLRSTGRTPLARCDRRVLGNTALLYHWKASQA